MKVPLFLLWAGALVKEALAFMPTSMASYGLWRGSSTSCPSTGDPAGEFVRSSVRPATKNVTVTARRQKMPTIGESMALLFSPDKRQIDQNRVKFREVIWELQAAELEEVVPTVSRNVRFFLSTNTSIFMQEMLEELDRVDQGALIPMGQFNVTVEQQRVSLTNLFTLIMDFIELFVQHTKGELRSHQAVLKEILEAAQNKSALALDDKIRELRPYYREDFLTFLQSEYQRVSTPPLTEEAVVLSNLLQAIQARVLAEVEGMVGGEAGLVSRLLAFSDETQLQTALRGSFLNGSVQPRKFLEMLETVIADLNERLPSTLDRSTESKVQEMREMHSKLTSICAFTKDFIESSAWPE